MVLATQETNDHPESKSLARGLLLIQALKDMNEQGIEAVVVAQPKMTNVYGRTDPIELLPLRIVGVQLELTGTALRRKEENPKA